MHCSQRFVELKICEVAPWLSCLETQYPKTVMREEVGRQIGLSARKVQIWFQNQRQRARRLQAS
ncbi:hypothetical protein SCLCIDRAFT_1213522 [Scleroderma citrinum Foug A]|uniref:Homeobox domain-containing protein n=1 Tax=Scleroderma citrinum Foug A TaxID=1036808 RepID=A0A0C3E6T1_9AGAM|nr:hypothetical protein SCLCIDRAFT_1213522 [Scleroderma citrinum Foug A]